jgi:hypothetical protein
MHTENLELYIPGDYAASVKQHVVDVKQQCQMLQLLLNQKMTSFHFPLGLMYEDLQGAILDLWHSLLWTKLPNLTTIVIATSYLDETGTDWDIKSFIFTSMLTVFPNLEELRLENFVCDDADLSKIAQHLPRLRYLLFFLEEIKVSSCIR